MEHVYDDGGRKAAGYKGSTGDCATRAIAIACEIPYQDAYELVAEIGSRDRITKRRKSKSHPRTGVYSATMRRRKCWPRTPTT